MTAVASRDVDWDHLQTDAAPAPWLPDSHQMKEEGARGGGGVKGRRKDEEEGGALPGNTLLCSNSFPPVFKFNDLSFKQTGLSTLFKGRPYALRTNFSPPTIYLLSDVLFILYIKGNV